ncbi:MAG: hypothetical protein GTN93_16215 [Anaerolineae bacterium]|nr:hypothetical protein [Anaerolineae bacterium]
MQGGFIGQPQGKGFKQLQRETFDQLYGDLDFAPYEVQRPIKAYSEHHIVSLAVKGIDGFSPTSCLDIGCGQGLTTHVLSKHVDTV